MTNIQACIFDLDGVVVDTAKFHYKAWKRLANTIGLDLSLAENEQLKGVSRMASLQFILDKGNKVYSAVEKQALASKKNEWYLADVAAMTAKDILPGVQDFLLELQEQGIKIALGSASKNARTILQRVGISHYFEVIIDGTCTTKSKPDPQVFCMGATQLGVNPANCVVFEDAPKGVQAAINGGFYAVGVGESAHLDHAHAVISNFKGFNLNSLIGRLT